MKAYLRKLTKNVDRSMIFTGLLFILLFACTLGICANTFQYGDDFHYSCFIKSDLRYYISRNIEHYYLANGRAIVHVIVTLLLKADLWVWRILNPLAITTCVILCVVLAKPAKKHLLWVSSASIAIILSLDTQITRQSIYWLTGSINYLYPMLVLLIYWIVLDRAARKGKIRWYMTLIAFLAAATTEQASLMCVGITLLYILFEFVIKNNRPPILLWITFAVAITGMLTVICAPSMSYRLESTTSPIEGGTFTLILYNLGYQGKLLFYAAYSRTVHIPLFLSALVLLHSYIKKPEVEPVIRRLCIAALYVGVVCFLCYLWIPENITSLSSAALTVKMRMFLTAVAGGYLLTLASAAMTLFFIEKDTVLLFSFILGFGSQLAMLVSPVYGPRILCSFVFMTVLYTSRAFAKSEQPLGVMLLAGILCFLSDAPYMLVFIIAAALLSYLCKNKRIGAAAGAAALVLTALLTWSVVYAKTAENGAVYRDNLAAIEAYDASSDDILMQRKLPNDYYAWVMPYHNSYYDPYYNICFDLPYLTEVVWK